MTDRSDHDAEPLVEALVRVECDCWSVHDNLNLTADTCGCPCHEKHAALRYAIALCRNQVLVEAPTNAAVIQRYVSALVAIEEGR